MVLQRLSLSVLSLGLLLTGCRPWSEAVSADSPIVLGAGASFPSPLYQRWFSHLRVRKGISLGYDPVGSGDGEHQLLAGLVDFAGSDLDERTGLLPALTSDEWLRIPMTAGAVAIAYNHPDCELSLTREQLRLIVSEQIDDFGQLGCAQQPITLFVRQNGSGTTAHLRRYLDATAQIWHHPRALRVNSNEAMATALVQHPGSIGYLNTVFLNGRRTLQVAALETDQGSFVTPEQVLEIEALEFSGPGYPLTAVSWMVMRRKGLADKAAVLREAIAYGLSSEGQAAALGLGYLPLPESLLKRARIQLDSLQP